MTHPTPSQSPSSTGTSNSEGAQRQASIPEIISRIGENITALVKSEIDLAKAKVKRTITALGLGIALIVVAVVLALYGLGFLLAAGAHGLAQVLPLWASLLIVAAVIFIIVAILLLVGIKSIKHGTQQVPNPKEAINKDLDTARDAVREGLKKGSDQ